MEILPELQLAVRRPLGSLFGFVIFRSVQLIWTLAVLSILCGIFPTDFYTKAIWAAALVVVSIGSHWVACGYADESGLTIRRYFKPHFVPWKEIRNATWGGWDFARLVVTTEHPIAASTRFDFLYMGGNWQAFRRAWTPENVAWVLKRVSASD